MWNSHFVTDLLIIEILTDPNWPMVQRLKLCSWIRGMERETTSWWRKLGKLIRVRKMRQQRMFQEQIIMWIGWVIQLRPDSRGTEVTDAQMTMNWEIMFQTVKYSANATYSALLACHNLTIYNENNMWLNIGKNYLDYMFYENWWGVVDSFSLTQSLILNWPWYLTLLPLVV